MPGNSLQIGCQSSVRRCWVNLNEEFSEWESKTLWVPALVSQMPSFAWKQSVVRNLNCRRSTLKFLHSVSLSINQLDQTRARRSCILFTFSENEVLTLDFLCLLWNPWVSASAVTCLVLHWPKRWTWHARFAKRTQLSQLSASTATC